MIFPTTPQAIGGPILAFCQEIDPTQHPVYVPVQPRPGALPNFCFPAVEAHIAANGGGIRYGWTIWEAPGYWLAAEFHAVWVSPEGNLLDVTPKKDGEKTILFLPDSKRVWERKPVANIRRALSKNRTLREYLAICEEINQAAIRKATADGRLVYNMAELAPLFLKQQQFYCKLSGIPSPLPIGFTLSAPPSNRVGRNHPCPCGSGRKYKHCHLRREG